MVVVMVLVGKGAVEGRKCENPCQDALERSTARRSSLASKGTATATSLVSSRCLERVVRSKQCPTHTLLGILAASLQCNVNRAWVILPDCPAPAAPRRCQIKLSLPCPDLRKAIARHCSVLLQRLYNCYLRRIFVRTPSTAYLSRGTIQCARHGSEL